MGLFVFSSIVLVLSGLAAAAVPPGSQASSRIAVAGLWIGCLSAFFPVLSTLSGHAPLPLIIPWSVPWGSFHIALDGLSAFFCLPILLLSPLAGLYGCSYMEHKAGEGSSWAFLNLLVASMLLLVVSVNGILFLVCWETMALASFFLVAHEDEKPQVREAAWIYLVATHLGTVFLLVLFALLGLQAGSLDFARVSGQAFTPFAKWTLFVAAMLGFGSKAGFFPLHVWLPEAHPAAVSHVSALMSGVMIKMGIYGILRFLSLMTDIPSAWGWIVLLAGLLSGVLGVLFALAQHDLKRLLAYHSVENIGIIAIGIGTGMLGMSWNEPALVALGFGGGILHVLNHALFKGLLFLGAGSVIRATKTPEIDRMGGLLKRMPWTGAAFLAGSAAIAGLPPFNGFVSEFLLYFAGLRAVLHGNAANVLLAASILSGLSLIGGLALACFAKCFGIIFLGEPRDGVPPGEMESPLPMTAPMVFLAFLCLFLGMAAPFSIRLVSPAIGVVAPGMGESLDGLFRAARHALGGVSGASAVLVAVTALLVLSRKHLAGKWEETVSRTWDCGYARPSARMQYTASSFARPLTGMFERILGTRTGEEPVRGYFPKHSSFATHTPERAKELFFAPLFRGAEKMLSPLRALQHGRIQVYVLYIAATLVTLLVLKGVFRQ